MWDKNLIKQAEILLELALSRKIKIVTAESCTGGLISSLITSIAGSSQIFERGFITYSNSAKEQNLFVEKNLLEKFGAVSKEVAKAMAIGAVKNSKADVSVAVTGIAGPQGASEKKPVGLVYISSYNKLNDAIIIEEFYFSGDRNKIRELAVENAMKILIKNI